MAEDKAVDSTSDTTPTKAKAGGCRPMFFFLALIFILGAILGANEGMGLYGYNCGDLDPFECMDELANESEEEEAAGTVEATGHYAYKDYGADVSLNVPLKGGAVSGHVNGDCGGKISGSYDGKDNGVVSGTFAGTCEIFFVNVPVKGTYSGTVNKESKTIPISFTGGSSSFQHSDSLGLTY